MFVSPPMMATWNSSASNGPDVPAATEAAARQGDTA
jgi:hypothetical protein